MANPSWSGRFILGLFPTVQSLHAEAMYSGTNIELVFVYVLMCAQANLTFSSLNPFHCLAEMHFLPIFSKYLLALPSYSAESEFKTCFLCLSVTLCIRFG